MEQRLKDLEEARAKILRGGGEEKIAKQHNKGKLTARERIDLLLDPGSFHEISKLIGHLSGTPGDGIISGHGKIDGRKVFVYAQDATVKGGSIGFQHGIKLYKTVEMALEMRVPIIGLNDSPGARTPKMQEVMAISEMGKGSGDSKDSTGFEGMGMFALLSDKHGGSVFAPNTFASGVIPQISAIMGTCAGIAVYSPALTDFIYMIDKTSQMFITGPGIVKLTLGEDVTPEELGGAKIHSKLTGVSDFRCKDEKECLSEIRRLISFLPLNCDEEPPVVKTGDDPERTCDELMDFVPTDTSKPYDVIRVIKCLVDNGDFLEVKKEFAGEIAVGFGRMDGYTVGFVANQPKVRAGSLTVDSSDKQARFIRFCDCFNIPIVLLVDTPAYMPGSAQEHAGIIRHGAKVLYALCEATVPRIGLVLRKAYGGGNLGMGVIPGMQTDMILNWPTMETGVLGPEQSIMLFSGGKNYSKEEMAEMVKMYRDTFANPIRDANANTNLHDVITPSETRKYLIRSLEIFRGKKRIRYPDRKHGNIPL
ncbi:MAG: acyl-CoA carboxylase subunit beta [Spirochaetota bacterium]|nr:acyl-CoA carboxylase subunit beta [Spirochaetota bacterium]